MKKLVLLLSVFVFMGCSSDDDTSSTSDEPQAAVNFQVTNNESISYNIIGEGASEGVNPELTLKRGMTYTFTVNAQGHPFFINITQGTSTENAYNVGVTNNGVQNGTITFVVPMNAPDTLFYNCQFHPTMTNTITIID